MANLAIKGHATRGREVIALLEMLGGNNANNCYGRFCDRVYYINENGYIDQDFISHIEQNTKFIIYSLVQFEEKFPYEVGDKVKDARINDSFGRITNVRWDDNETQIIYVVEWDDAIKSKLTYFAGGLQPYKEESMEEKDEKSANHVFDTEIISFDIAQRDRYELDLRGKFEVVLREGKYYVERIKPKYPKTYIECAKRLDCFGAAHIDGYKNELLEKLQELLIARDAYWKIAGEQMGLGKPWEPDWHNSEKKFTVEYYDGEIIRDFSLHKNTTFSFPTKEMRDAFYENFKELIENVKELL